MAKIKRLELDDQTRQRIINDPTCGKNKLGSRVSQSKPYNRIGRLLNQPDVLESGQESPLKNVFGLLSNKIQQVMKGLFPFKLFSQEIDGHENKIEPVEVTCPEPTVEPPPAQDNQGTTNITIVLFY